MWLKICSSSQTGALSSHLSSLAHFAEKTRRTTLFFLGGTNAALGGTNNPDRIFARYRKLRSGCATTFGQLRERSFGGLRPGTIS
jgi:hypothetical protein